MSSCYTSGKERGQRHVRSPGEIFCLSQTCGTTMGSLTMVMSNRRITRTESLPYTVRPDLNEHYTNWDRQHRKRKRLRKWKGANSSLTRTRWPRCRETRPSCPVSELQVPRKCFIYKIRNRASEIKAENANYNHPLGRPLIEVKKMHAKIMEYLMNYLLTWNY